MQEYECIEVTYYLVAKDIEEIEDDLSDAEEYEYTEEDIKDIEDTLEYLNQVKNYLGGLRDRYFSEYMEDMFGE